MTRSLQQEIRSFTTLRGVAALWVVSVHAYTMLCAVLPEAVALKPLIFAGPFAVPLFFVLSGYVIGNRYMQNLRSPSRDSILRFWAARLGRVYPVHLVTLLISLALVARHGWPDDEGHSLGSFIANCLLVQSWTSDLRLSWNYPSWSISSEWFAYLIFPIIVLALSNAKTRSVVVLLVLSCAFSAAVYASEPDLPFRGLVVVVPTFVGGVSLSIVCPPGAARTGGIIAAAALVIAALLPFLTGPGPMQGAGYLLVFFALVMSLALAGHHAGLFWQSRPLVYLGEISYSLYMSHVIVLTLVSRFVPISNVVGSSFVTRCVAAAIGLLTILLAAAGMYYSIERPSRSFSRRLIAVTNKRTRQGVPDHPIPQK